MIKRRVTTEPFPLKEMYFWLYFSAIAIVVFGLITSCHKVNEYVGLSDDNVLEEILEVAIEYETGVSIDLTPGNS